MQPCLFEIVFKPNGVKLFFSAVVQRCTRRCNPDAAPIELKRYLKITSILFTGKALFVKVMVAGWRVNAAKVLFFGTFEPEKIFLVLVGLAWDHAILKVVRTCPPEVPGEAM